MPMIDRKKNWPVVDGIPTKPYALPDDPARDRQAMDAFEAAAMIRAERERTRPARTFAAVAAGFRARKGRGFEITLLRRVTLEFHRRPTLAGSGIAPGTKYRIELYRHHKWDLNVEFWRSRKTQR